MRDIIMYLLKVSSEAWPYHSDFLLHLHNSPKHLVNGISPSAVHSNIPTYHIHHI